MSARARLLQAIDDYAAEVGSESYAKPIVEQLRTVAQDLQAHPDPSGGGRVWDNERTPQRAPDWPEKEQMVIQIKAGG